MNFNDLTEINVFGNEFAVGPGTEIPDDAAIKAVLTYLEVDPEVHILTKNGTKLFITARTGSKGALSDDLKAKLDSVKDGGKEVIFIEGSLVPASLLELGFTVEEIQIAENSGGSIVLNENMTEEEFYEAKDAIAKLAKEFDIQKIREILKLDDSVTDDEIVSLAKIFQSL